MRTPDDLTDQVERRRLTLQARLRGDDLRFPSVGGRGSRPSSSDLVRREPGRGDGLDEVLAARLRGPVADPRFADGDPRARKTDHNYETEGNENRSPQLGEAESSLPLSGRFRTAQSFVPTRVPALTRDEKGWGDIDRKLRTRLERRDSVDSVDESFDDIAATAGARGLQALNAKLQGFDESVRMTQTQVRRGEAQAVGPAAGRRWDVVESELMARQPDSARHSGVRAVNIDRGIEHPARAPRGYMVRLTVPMFLLVSGGPSACCVLLDPWRPTAL